MPTRTGSGPPPVALLCGFHVGLCIGATGTGHYPLAIAFGGVAILLGLAWWRGWQFY